MQYKDRDGHLIIKDTRQDRFLRTVYTKRAGRFLVRLLITKPVTKVAAFFLRSRLSAYGIKGFIRKNEIDMSQYEARKYISYNDFFTRKIREGCRPVDLRPEILISPCDGKASAFRIEEDTHFTIKGTAYTVASILKNNLLAAEYSGGLCILLRLTVDDYHRYCYVDDGVQGETVFIPGVLHTVNPVAAEHAPIYKENSRAYTVIETAHFGRMIQMEVGALVVGKIVNQYGAGHMSAKGEEKGRFEFGGSTILLFLQKDRVEISPDILENTGDNCETIVKLGEEIGRRCRPDVTSGSKASAPAESDPDS